MPELKNTFTGGKMNKDMDERIVPRGEYRDALNIEVSTSEDSDVGAAQNILGNRRTTWAASGLGRAMTLDKDNYQEEGRYAGNNEHIAHAIDVENNKIYRFIHTEVPGCLECEDSHTYRNQNPALGFGVGDPLDQHPFKMDRIIEYDPRLTDENRDGYAHEHERAVLIDIYEVHSLAHKGPPMLGGQLIHPDPYADRDLDEACYKQTIFYASYNSYQMRWGMQLLTDDSRVTIPGNSSPGITLDDDVNVVNVKRVLEPSGSPQTDIGMVEITIDKWIPDLYTMSYGQGIPFKLVSDRVLNFSKDRHITGVNVIDGMLFWTDNFSEPKKINIERCKAGSLSANFQNNGYNNDREYYTPNIDHRTWSDFDQHTLLIVDDKNPVDCMKNEWDLCNSGGKKRLSSIMGCTDPLSKNYNPAATINDGSCNDSTSTQYTNDIVNTNTLTPTSSITTQYGSQGCTTQRVSSIDYGDESLSSFVELLNDAENTPSISYMAAAPPPLAPQGPTGTGITTQIYTQTLSSVGGSFNQTTTTLIDDGLQQWVQVDPSINFVFDDAVLTEYTGVNRGLDDRYDPTINPCHTGMSGYYNSNYCICRPLYVQEKHISVIRKGPTTPPKLEMFSYIQPDVNNDGVIDIRGNFSGVTYDEFLDPPTNTTPFPTDPSDPNFNPFYPSGTNVLGASRPDLSTPMQDPLTGDTVGMTHYSIFCNEFKELSSVGDEILIPIIPSQSGEDWQINDKLEITGTFLNVYGNTQTCYINVIITNPHMTPTTANPTLNGFPTGVLQVRITSISANTPVIIDASSFFDVKLVQKPPMFEKKFPKFGYRYKFEDGEYSVFSPWSEVAFIPGEFDYLPKKGYNLGMSNNVRSLKVTEWVPKNIPKDVVQIDILYKESNSPNIYTVDSLKPIDPAIAPLTTNPWHTVGNSQTENKGVYTITTDLIHAVLPSNQLLRPWDNVPRVAQAQEITANRLIYANYVQNYNVLDNSDLPIKPIFSVDIDSFDPTSLASGQSTASGLPAKSLKSMRNYQLGVVYRDRYGRETPVLTSESGTFKISKSEAVKFNKINVSLNTDYPEWAESYTFYIKETSNEYYNLALDRWYDAEDGGIWLSFPSSERNKITDETHLILKKQHDNDKAVIDETTYKVLSIKNDAPPFIKKEEQFWGSLPVMLPPPGWGTGGKPGGWASGMFYSTGLPLPERRNLDIYAEYWDQSVFAELDSERAVQVRVVQAPGFSSSYSSTANLLSNKSKWYDVAHFARIGASPQLQEIEVPDPSTGGTITTVEEEAGVDTSLVSIVLEKVMGSDLGFCTPTDNLELSRGLSVEAKTTIVRDKAQFDGRFFVKIHRDGIIENNIIAAKTAASADYQVLMSRDIKYISAAHPGVQDWSRMSPMVDADVYPNQRSTPIHYNAFGQQVIGTTGPQQFTNYIPHGPVDGGYDMSTLGGQGSGYQNPLGHQPDYNACRVENPQIMSSLHQYAGEAGWQKPNQSSITFPPDLPAGFQAYTYLNQWSPTPPTGITYWTGYGAWNIDGNSGIQPFSSADWPWPFGPGCYSGAAPTGSATIVPSPPNVHGGTTFLSNLYDWFIFDCRPTQTPDCNPIWGTMLGRQSNDWPSFIPSFWSPPGTDFVALVENTHIPQPGSPNTPADHTNFGYAHTGIGAMASVGREFNNCTGTPPNVVPSTTLDSVATTTWAGINPFNKPAIWGDNMGFGILCNSQRTNIDTYPATDVRSPYYSPTGNDVGQGKGEDEFGNSYGKWIYDANTIKKLSEDWTALYEGYDLLRQSAIDADNPDIRWAASKDWDRWFIDKVGAASGYSGNGIWDGEHVSYMDISYFGIGDTQGTTNRPIDGEWEAELDKYQGELEFAQYLKTPGTKFRFKQDPDQIVYTITACSPPQEVYNYEAPIGRYPIDPSWQPSLGCGSPVPDMGAGATAGVNPPWGGLNAEGVNGTQSLAGKTSFLSDFYNDPSNLSWPKSWAYGSHFLNKRIRYTVKLDRKIGMGPNGFHPITRHVDENGKANILGGRKVYDVDMGNIFPHLAKGSGSQPSGVPGGMDFTDFTGGYAKGATPTSFGRRFRMYNLSSYWNADTVPAYVGTNVATYKDYEQSNDAASQATGQHIGLHERGLNQTTIEIVGVYEGDETDKPMSTNPAIFETEPMEDVGLDIYYAASPSYPISLKRHRNEELLLPNDDGWVDYHYRDEEYIPVLSTCTIGASDASGNTLSGIVDGIQDNLIWLNSHIYEGTVPAGTPTNPPIGSQLTFKFNGQGRWYGAQQDELTIKANILAVYSPTLIEIEPITHNERRTLSYFNCYSFGNGVESNRIRDDYNAVTIDKGVKASAPLAEAYEEERKKSGLIFSGIYNSTSGINETNQFIQAEPITKDLNPENGSIQKLYARDTDLVTFCENKVFKILAKKDALFNADGNTNVTASANVLGQTIPFVGEYGIGKHPESFAAESYRLYFTDQTKGSVLRLSRDGITNISNYGMKDWFKDYLYGAKKEDGKSIIGSYDEVKDQYNLTIQTTEKSHNPENKTYTLSYSESTKGWVSFKSFIQQDGFSHNNSYYTVPNNDYYSIPGHGTIGEMWEHHRNIDTKIVSITSQLGSKVNDINSKEVVIGANVIGDGIRHGTTVTAIDLATGPGFIHASTPSKKEISNIEVSEDVAINSGTEVTIQYPRNNFYGIQSLSTITTVYNGKQGNVKRFKTINYEGSQAEITRDLNDTNDLYDNNNNLVNSAIVNYNNWDKNGWKVEEITTDCQDGYIPEFIGKECSKWYNYIRGFEDAGIHDSIDTAEFSVQGLGYATDTTAPLASWDCINGACVDPGTGNGQYNQNNGGLAACQTNCTPVTWNCHSDVGSCIDPGDGSGDYHAGNGGLAACQQNCNVPESWECVNGNCIDPGDGSGTYADLATCQTNCIPPISESYDCGWMYTHFLPQQFGNNLIWTCTDPGDGSGAYSTLADCQTSCRPPDCDPVPACAGFDPPRIDFRTTTPATCGESNGIIYFTPWTHGTGSQIAGLPQYNIGSGISYTYTITNADTGVIVDGPNQAPWTTRYASTSYFNNPSSLTGGVPEGNYKIHLTDANGCEVCEVVTVHCADSFECFEGVCTLINGTGGSFNTWHECDNNGLADCLNPQPPPPPPLSEVSYNCLGGYTHFDACVDPGDGSGIYASIHECYDDCPPNGECSSGCTPTVTHGSPGFCTDCPQPSTFSGPNGGGSVYGIVIPNQGVTFGPKFTTTNGNGMAGVASSGDHRTMTVTWPRNGYQAVNHNMPPIRVSQTGTRPGDGQHYGPESGVCFGEMQLMYEIHLGNYQYASYRGPQSVASSICNNDTCSFSVDVECGTTISGLNVTWECIHGSSGIQGFTNNHDGYPYSQITVPN